MKINYTIDAVKYHKLNKDSAMLARIHAIVKRYGINSNATTFECTLEMDTRVRKLNKKLEDLKLERENLPKVLK